MNNFTTLQGSATLIIVIVLLIVVVFIAVILLGLFRKVSVEREEEEYEAALRDAMRRKVGVSVESEAEIASALVQLARMRKGAAIIIEGSKALEDIEDSGDTFGFGQITSEFLVTLLASRDMSRGALLIRRDHIVAYNCKMPIYREETLIANGAGNRHLGAFGTVKEFPDSIVLVVSQTTGKISIFGYLGTTMSIDFGLQLRDTDVINGVTESEIEYRLHSLLENTGMMGDLNGDEIQRAIIERTETKEERRERLKRERKQKQDERNRKNKEKQEAKRREQVLREQESNKRKKEKQREAALRKRQREKENQQRKREREEQRRSKLRGDDIE